MAQVMMHDLIHHFSLLLSGVEESSPNVKQWTSTAPSSTTVRQQEKIMLCSRWFESM
jgi:hypothetical protein